MFENLIFQVPAKFEAAVRAGEVLRYGGILKEVSTGQIVGHLQETGLAQKLLSSAFNGPLAPVQAISSLAANFQISQVSSQLVQVKSMLEVMQVFQYATLGSSLVGVGVSAIGFSVLNKKIEQVVKLIDSLRLQVGEGFDAVRAARLRDWVFDVNGILVEAEHKVRMHEVDDEWLDLGKRLMNKGERFRGELIHLLEAGSIDEITFDLLVSNLSLCNRAAMQAFMQADHLEAVWHHAEATAKRYNEVFDEISPMRLAQKLRPVNPVSEGEIDAVAFAKTKVSFIREMQESVATTPSLVESLVQKRVKGSDYLRMLEAENESPFLVLAA